MARWTGTWLSGLGAAGVELRPVDGWRGRRLGLPPEGPGAIATTGARIAAFMVDALASGLVAALLIPDQVDPRRGLLGVAVLAIENILLLSLTGRTFGMQLLGLRVRPVRADDARIGFLPACVRTALLTLLVPALIFDRDGRGLHDKAAGTVVVKAKGAKSFAA